MSILRSVWQTYWLHENFKSPDDLFKQLSESLIQMQDRFDDFLQLLDENGWDVHQMNLKVPKEISICELDPV